MTLTDPAPDPGSRRTCLLVVGMHRSGTSALTRVLGELGAALPRTILGADPDNQSGHWEPERLIPVHDALLAEAGSSWRDWQPFPAERMAPGRLAHYASEIRRIIAEEYGDAPLFVLKDPRLCRLLPFYIDLLGHMNVAARPVIAYRNPLEVAASLAARNRMPKVDAVLLWLRSVVDAERASRGLPRAIVSYDRLLTAGSRVVAECDRQLGVTWPMVLDDTPVAMFMTLRKDLRHHTIRANELSLDDVTSGWMQDAFAALRALESDAMDQAARGVLDRVATEFSRATPLLAAVATAAREEADRLRVELAHHQAVTESRVRNAEAAAAERQAVLHGQIESSRNRIAALEAEVAELQAQSAARTAELTRKLEHLETASIASQGRFLAERERAQRLQSQYDAVVHTRRWRVLSAITRWYRHPLQPLKRLIRLARSRHTERRLRRHARMIRRSGRFDVEYYLHRNADVAREGIDPIRHYLMHGASEGRNPAADFDTMEYLALHPHVARAGINPLVHAVRNATWWKRPAPEPEAPANWPPLQPEQLGDVSIVIPVYNGRDHLERLLPALARNTSPEVEVIFIDDGSPDHGLEELIAPLSTALPHARYVRHAENRGFVQTVNAGAELARRHFAILNTDTVVPPGWVERLMAPIFADPSIASATPFSNAATIFSFPRPNEDNRLPAALSADRLDAAFRDLPSAEWPGPRQLEAPTGVGFCMAVNGDVWRTIGGFDAAAFGRGYGEENDWCQRAVAGGYRNVLVPNLYVHHDHGGSFAAGEKQQLIARHTAVLNGRWPGYLPAVQRHIARDPWRALRGRALEAVCLRNGPLIVLDHALGGGANAYRKQLTQHAEADGLPVVVVTPRPGRGDVSATYTLAGAHAVRLASRLTDLVSPQALTDGATLVCNELVSWPEPLAALASVRDLAVRENVRLRLLVHDYYAICPSYTLLNDETRFCGVPEDLEVCRRCLSCNPHAAVKVDIHAWRRAWGDLLASASEVVCFSESSRAILTRAYPPFAERMVVRPHEPVTTIERPVQIEAARPLTVGVIGSLNVAKGARVVMDLCAHLGRVATEARVVVIGEVDPAELRQSRNLQVHGRYAAQDLPSLVERYGVNSCLLPSICPETFSYVTQEIMAMQLPLVCFNLGAPADRVSRYAYGVVIPPGDPAAVHRALEQARQRRGVA